MAEQMPSSDRESPDEVLRKLEEALEQLRAAASTPAEPESWTTRAFGSSSASTRQQELNMALMSALTETLRALQAISAEQKRRETHETRLDKIAHEMSEVRALSDNLDAFRERSDRLEAELRSAGTNIKGLQERAAALETELAQARQTLAAEQQRLSNEMHERIEHVLESLSNEMRERIQHVLDEQRVCIRQLSLQASEAAVLADRARRATELKLEELERRIAPPPA